MLVLFCIKILKIRKKYVIDIILIWEESIEIEQAYKSNASDWDEKSSFCPNTNIVFVSCCSDHLWWYVFLYYYFSLCYII